MKIEDYNKYYIQGSDHYLIPKDVFKELFNEMVNWKEESKGLNQKYLNAVADYETTMSELQELKKENKILRENSEHNDKVVDKVNWENQSLKKQLEENKNKINWYENFEINKTIDKLRIKHNNQQKEFIEWLENGINQVRNTEFLDEIIQRAGLVAYNRVLSKYKKIIGVPIAGLDDEEEPDLFEMIEDMKNKPKYIEEIKLVEIQNLWDRDIEIEKKLKEITKAVNYLLDKDKK